jgi:hypothetical protein
MGIFRERKVKKIVLTEFWKAQSLIFKTIRSQVKFNTVVHAKLTGR